MPSELTRQIEFTAAYDKRDPNPSKNYGIHGVEMRWYVKGLEGAVQWVVYTNWQLPHVQKEADERALLGMDEIGLSCFYHPSPADLGYHSKVPRYEGQDTMTEKCQLLGDTPCYYDGSGLNAELVFEKLLRGGSEVVWKYLEDYYRETFNAPDR